MATTSTARPSMSPMVAGLECRRYGFCEEDRIYLVLTGLKDTVQFSSRLKGSYDAVSGSIQGDLLQVINGNISLRSHFLATWINPDISSYTAAQVAPPGADASALGQNANATAQAAVESVQCMPHHPRNPGTMMYARMRIGS